MASRDDNVERHPTFVFRRLRKWLEDNYADRISLSKEEVETLVRYNQEQQVIVTDLHKRIAKLETKGG